MKGLLLKDFYMITKYCKAYLLIVVVFIAISLASNDNLLFFFYPCLLAELIPPTLLSYDEQSNWNKYVGTLPYSKAQIVSGKYLIGLLAQIFIFILSGIIQIIKMSKNGNFVFNDYLVYMMMLLISSCVTSSICLPFMFKFGVEKGRLIYYIMMGLMFASSAVASKIIGSNLQAKMFSNSILPILCTAGIAIYIFSWYLSIVLYKSREIK